MTHHVALGDLIRYVSSCGRRTTFVIGVTIVFIHLSFVIPLQGRLPRQSLKKLSGSSFKEPSERTRKTNLQTRKPPSFKPGSIHACVVLMRKKRAASDGRTSLSRQYRGRHICICNRIDHQCRRTRKRGLTLPKENRANPV
jgi:hypothetical protein